MGKIILFEKNNLSEVAQKIRENENHLDSAITLLMYALKHHKERRFNESIYYANKAIDLLMEWDINTMQISSALQTEIENYRKEGN